jgi:hypothetical protein
MGVRVKVVYEVTNGLLDDDGLILLRRMLGRGIVQVTFTKADGSTRVMAATLDFDSIPEDNQPSGSGRGTSGGDNKLLVVYDTQIDEWRSFRANSVIEWEEV